MNTYKAKFTGREVGAIGQLHKITTTVTGESEEQARLNLYDRWDHIQDLTLTMKPLTKKERKERELNRHYKAIKGLLDACEVYVKDENKVKKISNKLREIEHFAHKAATDYCNGENGMTTDKWGEESDEFESQVQTLFNGKLKGLRINGDARGYALKIDDAVMRTVYNGLGLQTDWGGYGLLAPEITGN